MANARKRTDQCTLVSLWAKKPKSDDTGDEGPAGTLGNDDDMPDNETISQNQWLYI